MNVGVTASSRHGLSEDALFRKARGEFQLFSDDEADDFVEFAEKVMQDPNRKNVEPCMDNSHKPFLNSTA